MGESPALLLVNPRSGGENRKGLALAQRLRAPGGASAGPVRVRVLDDFRALPDILKEAMAEETGAVFISAGDGTVQAIQTWLGEHVSPEHLPPIGILPHGSTNMTAAELGLNMRALADQEEFIRSGAWRRSGERVRRPSLRVANPRAGGPQHGMFLGGGAIAEGTLFCQEAFNRKGVRGTHLAPALTLARATGRALFSGPARPEDAHRLDRPWPMRVVADGEVVGEGLHVALLASTLGRLVFGARPFAETETRDALRFSLFRHPPPPLWRWLPVIVWGRKSPQALPPGMVSRPVRRLEVETSAPFVIDGERLTPPENEPLVIERGPMFTFLTGARSS